MKEHVQAEQCPKIFLLEPDTVNEKLLIDLNQIDQATLEEAYEICRKITREGSKTFYFSTIFLPKHKKRALWAVYTFCRYTDDLVDKAQGYNHTELVFKLDSWERELLDTYHLRRSPSHSHMLAWQQTTNQFKIPLHAPLDLIEGMRMDLVKNRYHNYEELRLYCYRVASTVGLMASHIIGFSEERALEFAIELGIAMQLTNILRDVGEDSRNGRIYIPLDEMQYFGYTEEELFRGELNERFINLMKFQIERARRIYQQAQEGIKFLDKDSQLAIATAAHLYSNILDIIERNNYDVFNRRAFVPWPEKIKGLFRIWKQRRGQ